MGGTGKGTRRWIGAIWMNHWEDCDDRHCRTCGVRDNCHYWIELQKIELNNEDRLILDSNNVVNE